ncbi:MAG: hypothetical protein QXJ73_09185 [Candidatus Caldarchaeum sp.]
MKRTTAAKLGGFSLLALGLFEVGGGLLALVISEAPPEIRATIPWHPVFALWLGLVFGFARILAGYGSIQMKKWGVVAGVLLSMETVVVVPSTFTSGLVGGLALPVALLTLFSLLYAMLGSDTLRDLAD